MDSRRRLIERHPGARILSLICLALLLPGCSTLTGWLTSPSPKPAIALVAKTPDLAVSSPPLDAQPPVAPPLLTPMAAPAPTFTAMAPMPNPPERGRRLATTPATAAPKRAAANPSLGRQAITIANRQSRAPSRAAAFVGGIQVFAFDPGRQFEIWTAPLRVTTLTLSPGETIIAKAAGDTVRWQIGETTSGEGASHRAHVMIKPLERGLETNMVTATSQRVYQLLLRSGPTESFNAVVTWDPDATSTAALAPRSAGPPVLPALSAPTSAAVTAADEPRLAPTAGLDARYRIAARGKSPSWAPTSVMTDGVRTLLIFPPQTAHGEAPVLFVRGRDGEVQLVNYRQQNDLWIVDRVVEQGELRLGDRPRDIVFFSHQAGGS